MGSSSIGYFSFFGIFILITILVFFLNGLKWKKSKANSTFLLPLETRSSGQGYLLVLLSLFFLLMLPTFRYRNESLIYFWLSLFFGVLFFASWFLAAQRMTENREKRDQND